MKLLNVVDGKHYNGKYAVDEFGNVYSSWSKNGSWKKLKPKKDRYGYFVYCLRTIEKRNAHHTASVLVLHAFVGPRPPKMVARHLDDNKQNNTLSNLAWGTHRDNVLDKFKNGYKMTTGEDCSWAKVKSSDVLEIRRYAANGVTYKELASKYGMSVGGIGNIVRRNSWNHI